ncbi:hypothetical protein XH97_30480 [Bradyrhizobium sp. CCBAU 53380]|nr:hypothetical protein [Bradyrhizobium sp. CCBAU 53380]
MIGGADCKFRGFDAANRGEVQIGGEFGRTCRDTTMGMDPGDNFVARMSGATCGNIVPDIAYAHSGRGTYWFAGACG